MRNKLSFLLALLFICAVYLQAQKEKSDLQFYVVHEDYVKPSMAMEYEKAAMNIKTKMKEHNISDFRYMAFSSDEFIYGFVSPIENMAQMDKKPFSSLEEKMGMEASAKMWEPMVKCYDTHKTYIVKHHMDLSYTPEAAGDVMEENNYRIWQVYYIQPDKEKEAFELSKKWKELYTKHKAEFAYSIYTGVVGTDDPMFLVSVSGKNRADLAKKMEKLDKSIGEEGQKLNAKTMAITLKMEIREGMMRNDLAYWPVETVATK